MSNPVLDRFGSFLMERLRDRGISFADGLVAGSWKSPTLLPLQSRISAMTEEDKAVMRAVVVESLDNAIHDFLFGLVEATDFQSGIELYVDGANVVNESDGLHGEIFGEDGWVCRFSSHPPANSAL